MEEITKDGLTAFDKCDKCGYENGFHVTFRPIKFTERASVILKCPNCGQTYNLNWSISFDT